MKRRLPAVAGALGILGSLACSIAMVLALLGLLGAGVAAGAASTGDMTSMSSGPALAPRNSSLPAPLLTILLYLFQASRLVMYLTVGVGLAALVAAYLWSMRTTPDEASRAS